MIVFLWVPFACGLALACIAGAGWLVMRGVLRISERSLLLPLIPVAGASAASVWLNGAGKLIGWQPAVMLLALAGLIGCIHFICTWRTTSVTDEWKTIWKWGIMIFITCLLLALIGGIFDETWHFPLAGLIANGNWPAAFFLNPDLPLLYHYGFDLLVAFAAALGTPVPLASDFLVAILQTSIVVLVYQFLRTYACTNRYAALATVLVMFAASTGWLLRPFRAWLPDVLAGVAPFHGSTVNALFLVTYTKSLLIAASLLMALLVLMQQKRAFYHGWRGTAVIITALAAAALSSETLFVVFAPVVCLGYLFGKQSLAWGWRIIVLVVAVVMIVLQGGMLSSFAEVIVGKGAESAIEQNHTKLSFAFQTSRDTFGAPLHFATGQGMIRGILELFGFIILGIFAFAGWKRWSFLQRALLVAAGVSLLIPFFVHYNVLDREMVRFWIGTVLVTNLLGAAEIVRRIPRISALLPFATFLILGGIASTLLLNIPITWMGRQEPVIISRALWIPYISGETKLPKGSIIWAEVSPKEGDRDPIVMQVPLVFGVYAQSCQDLFGSIVREDCGRFAVAPSEEGLDRLRVTHVLLSDTFLARHAQDAWIARLSLVQAYQDRIPNQIGPFFMPGQPGGWSLFAVFPPET